MSSNNKKDKKNKIIWGIPMYPDYLDCRVEGDTCYDRFGNKLSYKQRKEIYRKRRQEREEWLESLSNIEDKEGG